MENAGQIIIIYAKKKLSNMEKKIIRSSKTFFQIKLKKVCCIKVVPNAVRVFLSAVYKCNSCKCVCLCVGVNEGLLCSNMIMCV